MLSTGSMCRNSSTDLRPTVEDPLIPLILNRNRSMFLETPLKCPFLTLMTVPRYGSLS